MKDEGKENPKPERKNIMKTVEIVKTKKGWHVSRLYCGRNQGAKFFFSVAPADMPKTKAKKFLQDSEQAKQDYIKEWVGE